MKTKIVALIAAIAFFAVTVSPSTFADQKKANKSNKTVIERLNSTKVVSDSTKTAPKKSKKMSKKTTHHKMHTTKSKKSSKSTKSKSSSKTKYSKTHKMTKDTTGTK